MWLIYAIIGAFGKSFSSLFRKKLAADVGPATFMWVSYSAIILLLSPFIIPKFDDVMFAFSESPIILIAAAASIMIATAMNLEALKREELSYLAPLNAFVPIFTLVIAILLIGESPPTGGITGIFMIFIGAYVINLKPARVRWYDPIKHMFTNLGALLSLGVAFGYAVNTVLMKEAYNRGYDEITILFAITVIGWLFLLYVPLKKANELKAALSSSKVYLFGAIISSLVGSFFHILAIAGTYASYAVSIRRFESVVSVLLGWRYLQETNIKTKLIGSILMVLGVIVMALYR